MDLLANYGSDEEDDQPAIPSSSGAKIIFSLPPPRAYAQATSLAGRPPKEKSATALGPKTGPTVVPYDFFDQTSKVSDDETTAEVREKSSSLFSKLPPPASSTRLSLASLLPPPLNSKTKKKTVEFKPPVNLSVLEPTYEDEEDRSKKRSKVSELAKPESVSKVGGLAALLPPPKNSLGSGLAFGGGGGGTGGRRTAMETASVSSKTTNDINLPKSSTGSKEGDTAAWQSAVNSSETQMRVNPNSQYHYSAQPGQGHIMPNPEHEVRMPGGNYTQEKYTGNGGYRNEGYQDNSADGAYQNELQQGYSNRQYPETYKVAAEPSSSSVSDPLAGVFERERRKGRNEPPPQFIEVKQADLTAGRMREDQLRTTGIAFGPNYQPVSSGKDKPSKIHRRKHQIGALYFDMKSKEMELLDRRSKGNLTKAETQAKYGW